MDSQQNTKDSPTATFSINSESTKFTSKSKDIFGSLGVLEDKHSEFLKARTVGSNDDESQLFKPDSDEELDEDSFCSKPTEKEQGKRSLSNSSDFVSKPMSRKDQDQRNCSSNRSTDYSNKKDIVNRQERGAFRKPRGSAPYQRNRGAPDFKKHPEKYTCYSLDDVSEHAMSERSNAKAAFAFLEEKRKERERLERKAAGLPEEEVKFDVDNGACSQGRISFTRQSQKEKSVTGERNNEKKGERNNEKKVKDLNLVNTGSQIINLKNTADDVDKEDCDTADLNEEDTLQTNLFFNSNESKATVFKAKGKKQRNRNIRKKEDNSNDSDG